AGRVLRLMARCIETDLPMKMVSMLRYGAPRLLSTSTPYQLRWLLNRREPLRRLLNRRKSTRRQHEVPQRPGADPRLDRPAHDAVHERRGSRPREPDQPRRMAAGIRKPRDL